MLVQVLLITLIMTIETESQKKEKFWAKCLEIAGPVLDKYLEQGFWGAYRLNKSDLMRYTLDQLKEEYPEYVTEVKINNFCGSCIDKWAKTKPNTFSHPREMVPFLNSGKKKLQAC